MHAHCVHRFKRIDRNPEVVGPGGNIQVDHGPVPDRRHTCGIYAVKSPAKTLSWGTFLENSRTVVGTVALWGRVLPHQEGYKAEYAYPKFLIVLLEDQRPAGAKDNKFTIDESVDGLLSYGVPVETKYRHEIAALG